jgi:hypothetical protein
MWRVLDWIIGRALGAMFEWMVGPQGEPPYSWAKNDPLPKGQEDAMVEHMTALLKGSPPPVDRLAVFRRLLRPGATISD